jgi:hypothetical protein
MKRVFLALFFVLFLVEVSALAISSTVRDRTISGNKANVSKMGSMYGLNTDPLPATAIYTGQVDVPTATTRVQVSSSSVSVRSVTIKALVGNGGFIYVGKSDVDSSNGFELDAGESISVDVNNLNLLYVDTSNSGDDICYFAVN